jgi:hypothetical protein
MTNNINIYYLRYVSEGTFTSNEKTIAAFMGGDADKAISFSQAAENLGWDSDDGALDIEYLVEHDKDFQPDKDIDLKNKSLSSTGVEKLLEFCDIKNEKVENVLDVNGYQLVKKEYDHDGRVDWIDSELTENLLTNLRINDDSYNIDNIDEFYYGYNMDKNSSGKWVFSNGPAINVEEYLLNHKCN